MKFKEFFSKCDQNLQFSGIWSHLLKKSFRKNFIFGQSTLRELVNKSGKTYLCQGSLNKEGIQLSPCNIFFILILYELYLLA